MIVSNKLVYRHSIRSTWACGTDYLVCWLQGYPHLGDGGVGGVRVALQVRVRQSSNKKWQLLPALDDTTHLCAIVAMYQDGLRHNSTRHLSCG